MRTEDIVQLTVTDYGKLCSHVPAKLEPESESVTDYELHFLRAQSILHPGLRPTSLHTPIDESIPDQPYKPTAVIIINMIGGLTFSLGAIHKGRPKKLTVF